MDENKTTARNSTVFVNRTIGKKPVDPEEAEGTEEVLGVHQFVTQPAEVSVSESLSINLGNYESAKIGVTVMIPCYVEEVDKAYVWAQAWVEERLRRERDLVKAYVRDGKKVNPL